MKEKLFGGSGTPVAVILGKEPMEKSMTLNTSEIMGKRHAGWSQKSTEKGKGKGCQGATL